MFVFIIVISKNMKPISAFLKRRDALGQSVQIHHKGSSVYGTEIGGCCYLTVSFFFTMLVVTQLYSWAFFPDYTQSQNVLYMTENDMEEYEISTE